VVTHLSFGSEAGDIAPLQEVADTLLAPETLALLREEMKSGLSYPAACQKAAERLLGDKADVLNTPNNTLGIEYLKALRESSSSIQPLTVRRVGTMHDGQGAESASYLRRLMQNGEQPWHLMPAPASGIYEAEINAGRGPVFIKNAETALLSRLRILQPEAWARLPDATEGVQDRLMRCARTQPTLDAVLEAAKTKRYTLSRLRRLALCAALGITEEDSKLPPPYIRVLAMNRRGADILRDIKKTASLPVITKPAQAKELPEPARSLFQKEADATDLYALAFPGESNRSGGQEWTISPSVL
jgi:predicted nucleotidyltransferase